MSGGFFMPIKEKTVLMDGGSVDRALVRISHQILETNTDDAEDICLIGIKTRGEFLAERIADNIETIIGVRPSVSSLDITGFRDDVEALMSGMSLNARFMGTGYDPGMRMQGDFSSNIYVITMEET